jgi:hypothetical protein
MKRLILISTMFVCFVQAFAFAGTSVNVNLQIEIPDYVRAEKKEQRIEKHHEKKNDRGMRTSEADRNFTAVAEIPVVESNCKWNVVVMNEKEIVAAGAGKESIAKSAEEVVAGMAAGEESGSGAKKSVNNSNVELSYIFFAD